MTIQHISAADIQVAINRSVDHDEIVHVYDEPGMHDALMQRADNDVDTNAGVHEYWGEHAGETWRIHRHYDD